MSPRQKQYPPRNGGGYNLGVRSTLVTWFYLIQDFKNETRAAQASQIDLVTSSGYTRQDEAANSLWG